MVSEIIDELGLVAHPEGGYYKRMYESVVEVEIEGRKRPCCTGIYYLLTGDSFSSFHRLKMEEVWHFYGGDPLLLSVIDEEGQLIQPVLGMELIKGQRPQIVIPTNCWFGGQVLNPDGYTLVGCTVTPGFDFTDFELGSSTDLIKKYPGHHQLIEKLTRKL